MTEILNRKKLISIIVPLYNEEKRARDFLNSLIITCKNKLNKYEIILVNDGSIDNTLDMIKKISLREKNVKIISYKKNVGKSFAILQGIKKAHGEFILFIDADGSISPMEIPKMIEKLKDFDMVIGCRDPKHADIVRPIMRTIISKIFNFMVNSLFKLQVTDVMCGFKGFRRKVIDNMIKDIKSKQWDLDIELIYKARKGGCTIHSLPIKWVHKKGSNINIISSLKIFIELIKIRMNL